MDKLLKIPPLNELPINEVPLNELPLNELQLRNKLPNACGESVSRLPI
jgi:hypothetical protein